MKGVIYIEMHFYVRIRGVYAYKGIAGSTWDGEC